MTYNQETPPTSFINTWPEGGAWSGLLGGVGQGLGAWGIIGGLGNGFDSFGGLEPSSAGLEHVGPTY